MPLGHNIEKTVKKQKLPLFLSAGGANTLHHVFCLLHLVAFWQTDARNPAVLQAVGPATEEAGEMNVVEMMVIVATADAILLMSCAVIDLVQEMMLGEEAQGTEHTRPVHLRQPLLHIRQGEGAAKP